MKYDVNDKRRGKRETKTTKEKEKEKGDIERELFK
jgi:hypothetical protein